MRIVCQIGFKKTLGGRREGQLLKAFINDEECNWADGEGQYITSIADTKQKGYLWYLWSGDVEPGDSIRIVSLTTVKGGQDERRTFEAVYIADPETHVRSIAPSGVGAKGYPVLKGRVTELAAVSEADKREADIDSFLRDDNF